MNLTHLLEVVHYGCYLAIVSLAAYGVYCILLLRRQLKRRRFQTPADADEFVAQFREMMRQGNATGAEELCSAPEYWYRAVPLLARTVIEKRGFSTGKIRQAVAGQFAREILTSLESLIASISVVVKTEPMLGLLGTVVGMIGAFGKIATIENPSPQALMEDLSVALNATAMGLMSAIPLLLFVNHFQVQLRKFEDETFELVQLLVDDLEMPTDQRVPQAVRAR